MEKARKEINAAMQEAIAANAQAGDEAVENVENTEAAEKNVEKAEPAGEKRAWSTQRSTCPGLKP